MRRAAALACLVLASGACGKKESTQPAAGSGSSSSATAPTNDPWSKPASLPDAAEAPCDDADIKKHIEDSLAVSMAYLAALEKKTTKWDKDCEQAKKDLLALEPEAAKFMGAMKDFVTWAQTLGPSCAARVQALGDQMPQASAIETRTPALEAKVKPILGKCGSHPGFTEAAAKGLRVMHRKRAP